MGATQEPQRPVPGMMDAAGMVRRRRNRNLAMLAALLAFVAIIYVLSLVKMGGG